jgi:RNA polymerase sigma-70 factor (ECF subfamily)
MPANAANDDPEKARRFREAALPHLDEVYTLARYLLRNATDAEDAVQECYLRALKHFDGYRGPAMKPWLFAILRNVCHAAYAGNARLVFTAETGDLPAPPMWREDSDTPEQALVRRHDSDTMRRLIGELPAEFREVIVLREINDLSYRDIATVIEAPIGTVMSRLARARRSLQRTLTQGAVGGGVR